MRAEVASTEEAGAVLKHMTKASECDLSIIIKTLNEEAHIERTLQHVFLAVRNRNAEVIVADSASTDRTVELARRFPVRVFQLLNPGERSCGVGAQLGYQYSRGRFLLVMDGDMDLRPEFIDAALSRLQEDDRLAGVGGEVVDVNFDNIEYRARRARAGQHAKIGLVDRLNGGGLFRREAIVGAGYLTNRNLHSFEELEQGLRLQSLGWRLERLPMVAVEHHGHTTSMWTLLRRRWATGYALGPGELIRASFGQPWFLEACRTQQHLAVVIGWWLALLASLIVLPQMGVSAASTAAAWFVLLLLPPLLMAIRRRDWALGAYSVIAWCSDATGLLCGLLRRQRDPRQPIGAREVRT